MADGNHDQFMRRAIAVSRDAGASGNTTVGAVIVRDGEVIGSAGNSVNSDCDPTAHAEVAAIRDACRKLGTTDLSGTTLYTAMEPCPMCLWAICAAGIGTLVMGARHATFVRPELGDYAVERLLDMTGHPLTVVTGILTAECETLRPELPRR